MRTASAFLTRTVPSDGLHVYGSLTGPLRPSLASSILGGRRTARFRTGQDAVTTDTSGSIMETIRSWVCSLVQAGGTKTTTATDAWAQGRCR